MAIPAGVSRAQCLSRTLQRECPLPTRTASTTKTTTTHHRSTSTFTHLQTSLPRRLLAPILTHLSPIPSHRLNLTLADFLPASHPSPSTTTATNSPLLPLAHHLLYFEPTHRHSDLLPDGTNPDLWPGEPFTRRLWAGGSVVWNPDPEKQLRLDGGWGVCAEFIRGVDVRGREGEEKVFVAVERRVARVARGEGGRDWAHRVRQRLWRDGEGELGECAVVERRNLVFLRRERREAMMEEKEKQKQKKQSEGGEEARKTLFPSVHSSTTTTTPPDFTHTLTPDARLLFRYSALTFNSHAIHLDPEYTRTVEGHRNLLVHGPLSFTFLMTLLQNHLVQSGNEVVRSVEYRNLAPLYCGEPVRFCGSRVGRGRWVVWAETGEGEVAVRGKVVTGEEGVGDGGGGSG